MKWYGVKHLVYPGQGRRHDAVTACWYCGEAKGHNGGVEQASAHTEAMLLGIARSNATHDAACVCAVSGLRALAVLEHASLAINENVPDNLFQSQWSIARSTSSTVQKDATACL